MVEIVCIQCNSSYEAPRRGVKYCSAVCRERFYAHKYRAAKATRQRVYERAKHGYKPRPTEPVACQMCPTVFVPNKTGHVCCSKQCQARLRYRENPEKHRSKTRNLRRKYSEFYKARGRVTWAQMRAERGTPLSHHSKARHPWLSQFCVIRHGAKKKNIPFDLTREWCEQHWTGRCKLSGFEFVLNGKRCAFSPSIDKIVPSLGYVQSNCRFILWGLNAFKGVDTDEEMYRIAAALIANRPSDAEGVLSLPG